MTIYTDNAATTRMSDTAVAAMLPCLQGNYGNPSSLHSVGQRAAEALQGARETVARCLGCDPKEIIFTSGGSEADNQAIISAARYGEKKGNNEIGSILPIPEIGAVCREKGVLFHTDAVQAAGHLHINVREQNIDMLSLSGHKFHGPKGSGVLYAKKGIPLVNVIEGGAQERGKRAGTENLPAIVGMAAALQEACDHIDENAAKVTALRDKLIAGLSKIPHSALNGDPVHRLPGNVNFCFEGIEGESLLLLLDAKGICASSGSACTSGSLDPSHVLLAIGRPHEVAHGSLRLSLCEWNTEEEVDVILQEVPRVVDYLRNMSPMWKDLVSGKKPFMLK